MCHAPRVPARADVPRPVPRVAAPRVAPPAPFARRRRPVPRPCRAPGSVRSPSPPRLRVRAVLARAGTGLCSQVPPSTVPDANFAAAGADLPSSTGSTRRRSEPDGGKARPRRPSAPPVGEANPMGASPNPQAKRTPNDAPGPTCPDGKVRPVRRRGATPRAARDVDWRALLTAGAWGSSAILDVLPRECFGGIEGSAACEGTSHPADGARRPRQRGHRRLWRARAPLGRQPRLSSSRSP